MYSSSALPISRSSSGSSDSSSSGLSAYYTRADQPCIFSFRVGETIWARANGAWSLGVVVDSYLEQTQNGTQAIPTYIVLTRAGSPYAPLSPVTLSPLFGSLKPADTYTASLLRAEGVFPLAGTDRNDILDLQMKARAWLEKKRHDTRPRRTVR